jgi:hypothetical protein
MWVWYFLFLGILTALSFLGYGPDLSSFMFLPVLSFANRIIKIGTITGAGGVTRGIDLPRKDLYRELYLRTSLVNTLTTVGPAVAALNDPYPIIKRIEVIADGKDTLKSISGVGLMQKNYWFYRRYMDRTMPALSAAALTMRAGLIVPFAMPKTVREADTFLDSSRLSLLELRVTFGTDADLYTTQPTTTALTSISVAVHAHQAINLGKPLALGVYKEGTIEKQVSATTSALQVALPVGNAYRGFLIETEVDGNPADSLINNIKVQSGTTVFYNADLPDAREFWRAKNGLQNIGAGSVVVNPAAGYGPTPGYHYIDFCPEGRLADALNTANLSNLDIVFDVTMAGTTSYIRIFPDELVLPRIAAVRR